MQRIPTSPKAPRLQNKPKILAAVVATILVIVIVMFESVFVVQA